MVRYGLSRIEPSLLALTTLGKPQAVLKWVKALMRGLYILHIAIGLADQIYSRLVCNLNRCSPNSEGLMTFISNQATVHGLHSWCHNIPVHSSLHVHCSHNCNQEGKAFSLIGELHKPR